MYVQYKVKVFENLVDTLNFFLCIESCYSTKEMRNSLFSKRWYQR